MSQNDGLSRKKKVRAAHRASVTRTISQVCEMLSTDATEELDVVKLQQKLQQKKRTLEAKLDLLSKLDEEVGELIHEDELEVEIQQVDDFKERMELTICDLTTTLEHKLNLARSDDRLESPEPSPEPAFTQSGVADRYLPN